MKKTLQKPYCLLVAGFMLLFVLSASTGQAQGALDQTFNPGTGSSGNVFDAVLQPDGKIIIGGFFTSYNGTGRNHIARLNADGTLDAAFNPSGAGLNSAVVTVALQPDGKIVIGGYFITYDGISRSRIARLNADGTLDAGFNPGAGANSTVNSVALQPDGKIIIGGDFSFYDGTARNRVARLNANGTLDASFDPGTGANGVNFQTACLQPDGKIIIGGDFTTFNGVSMSGIARLNANGTLDPGFNPGTGVDGETVITTTTQPDGKIIIGGGFSTYNGTARYCIARLNANGTLDAGFTPVGIFSAVRTTLLQPDGKIVVVGDFNGGGGTFTRLNVDGTQDASFNPGTGPDNAVFIALLQTDGKIFIGGTFTAYNGTGRNRVARVLTAPTPNMSASLRDVLLVDANGNNIANPNDEIRYTNTIRNTGTEDALGVNFNDSVPINTTFNPGSRVTSPVAVNDTFTVGYNGTLNTGNLLTNDFGIPAPTVVRFGPTATLGNATNAGAAGTTDSGGTLTVNTNGSFTYTPALNYSGTDQFMYIDTTGVLGLPNNDAVVFITVTAPPTVTINQAAGQPDPAAAGSTVNFTVVFNQPVTGFDGTDVNVTGTAGLGGITKTVTGGPSTYNVAVSGATGTGTIIATVNAAAAVNVNGDLSLASTSTDNTITFLVPPTANPESYSVIGNVQIQPNVVQGVLANDAGTSITVTAVNGNPAFVGAPFTTPSGSVLTVQSDGSFTYNPGPGVTATAESFNYTINNGLNAPSTATVTLNVTGLVWFIQNGGPAGNGRLSNPFNSIDAFQAVNSGFAIGTPKPNQYIFVFENASPYLSGSNLSLQAGQKLIGQDASASLTAITGFIPNALYSTPFPVMTPGAGQTTTLTTSFAPGGVSGVTLGTDNLVRGLTIGNTSGAKIRGTSFGTVTLGDNTTPDLILNGSGRALDLTTGSFSATSGFISVASTSSGTGGTRGISLTGVGSSGAQVNFGSTTISGSTGQGIYVQGCTADINFGNSSVTGGSDGVSIQGNTAGTRTFGTLSISGSAATGLLHSSGGGQLTVTGATTITNPAAIGLDINGLNGNPGNISFNGITINKGSTAGKGLVVSATSTGRTLDFGALNITTSNGAAMEISGGGTFTASSGTISATGIGATSAAAIFANGVTLNATFTSVSSNVSGSGGTGISLTNVTGISNLGTGSLTGATGTTFLVSGGNGTVTYDGTISQANSAVMINIAGKTGGAVTLNGNLSFTPPSGNNNGIEVFISASSTINFNGTTKTITATGSGMGVNLASNTGSSINFTNGGLVINTQTGIGFNVVTNGTISVTGTGNSITTVSGIGLNLNSTVLAATGISFASITSTSGQVALLSGVSGAGTTTLGRINTTSGPTTALSLINAGTVIAGDAATSTLTTTSGQGILIHNTTLNLTGVGVDVNTTNGIGVNATGGTVAITGGNLNITTTSGIGFNAAGAGITVSLTAANNTVSTTTGTALNMQSSTVAAAGMAFASVSATGAFNGINLNAVIGTGNITIGGGSLTGNGGGATVEIVGGTASLTYSGNLTQAPPFFGPPLISVSGGHATGTITFNTGTLSATDGTGLQFNNADGTYNFNGTTTMNGGDAGIDILNGSSGTFMFGTGTSISRANGVPGAAFNLLSSNANTTYNGSITLGTSTGNMVAIDNHDAGIMDFNTGTLTKGSSTTQGISIQNCGGGTINFNNPTIAVTMTTGNAVLLTSNTGSTINFTPVSGGNGIDLTTTSGIGFNATGGGTINVTGTGNTITSTTGTALNVANTTIGGSGLTFLSISAGTAAGGPAKGISLNNTGAGGLTVTGSGTTNGSGGTIQDAAAGTTMQRGIELISAQNISLSNMTLSNACRVQGAVSNGTFGGNENTDENGSIHLQTVTNVSLNNVDINGSVQHGINGNVVTNFDYNNGVIDNVANAVWESGMYIFNLRGTSAASTDNTISNSTIQNTGQFNIFIQNNSATNAAVIPANYAAVNRTAMDQITLNNNQFINSGVSLFGDHVTIVSNNNGNMRTVVTNCTFTGSVGGPFGTSDNIQVDASGTGHSDVDISNSSFANGGQTAINISAAGNGFATFNVHDNPLVTCRAGVGINIAGNGSAIMRGFVQDNPHIYSTVPNNPGSGIQVFSELSGQTIVTLDNNVIERQPGFPSNGFQSGIRGYARQTGQLHLTVINNTVNVSTTNGFEGIMLDAGNSAPGENNTVRVNLANNTIDGSNGADDYLLTQYAPNTFQIQGLTPASGATPTQVQNYIAATDTDPSPTDPTVNVFGGLITTYTAGSPLLARVGVRKKNNMVESSAIAKANWDFKGNALTTNTISNKGGIQFTNNLLKVLP